MFKKLILYISLAASVMLPACNSSSGTEYQYDYSSSVIVNSFKLSEDKEVLDSLQNVFFSIDLVNARIFNADSLPYGTKVDRLVTEIKTPTTASAVTLEYPRPGKTDSIVDYLKNSTDSIDFSNGPVKLRVVSESGAVQRVYEVKVNVHQTKPDTLAWKRIESAPLPSKFTNPDAQCTAEKGGVYYILTSKAGQYSLATTTDPADPHWNVSEIEFSFVPDVESLRTAGSSLYILSEQGDLYKTDDFSAWASTGENWHSIYGAYADKLIGCKQMSDGSWLIASYPGTETWTMPDGFPISGATIPCTYDSEMAISAQLVMVGGRDSHDRLIRNSWGFDGNSWQNISLASLPEGLEGMMMVQYSVVNVPSSTWSPVVYPVLLATGGRNAEGAVNSIVYLSYDWGMTWSKAPELMQLPKEVPKVYGASAFVYSTTTHLSRANSQWMQIPVRGLYPQCQWLDMEAASRVEKPVTEWECPAIYMFGGRTPEGKTLNSVWRGVILRFTFVPVY